MNRSSLILSCFKWSVLNNGQLEFTSYHFKWSVLNNGQLELTFLVQKCHPQLHQKTRCHSLFRTNIKVIIPRFVGIRNIKFHSPFCRINGIPKVIPRFIGLRKKKTSFPGLPDYGSSFKFSFLKKFSPPGMSDNETSPNFFLKYYSPFVG